MSYRRVHIILGLLLIGILAGCAATNRAPIVESKAVGKADKKLSSAKRQAAGGTRQRSRSNAKVYTVATGDTLYSIAWRFDLDYRQLTAWNQISNPDRIFVGQTIRLTPPGTNSSVASGQTAAPAVAKSGNPAPSSPTSAAPRSNTNAETLAAIHQPAIAAIPSTASEASRASGGTGWMWPAQGEVKRAVAASGSIGLEIRGQRGQPIYAAAPGHVVYSGSGLRGYGQLIIVKHDDSFLSAYAHNDQLLVAEGATVQAGQKIAVMGDSESQDVMLHFEIRHNGKAVEPLQYLPKR